MESTGIEIAKWIVAAIAVFNGGGYIADAVIPVTARQHQRNPLWPPHAKFHNGQSMLMGIGLGLLSLFLLFGLRPLTLPALPRRHGCRRDLLCFDGVRHDLPRHSLGRS